ncbi:dystroglycan-like [Dorcoceras hygrometricum]|uniref:Dystroglycan-like n=1 Tax=Dorcoceras hygrometricum TaxID=472368 RepID=A0A2Z7B3P4_9LAMI|nr:dystroglycan-like [Dorcoceras hygrometricum]
MTLLMSSSLSAPADLYRSSSSLRLFLASVPAGPLAPADLSSSAEHDAVTNDIIIDGPLRCSSWFPFDFPAGPSSSSSACSWFISFQLIHYAPAGGTTSLSAEHIYLVRTLYCKDFTGDIFDKSKIRLASSFYNNSQHVDFDSVLAMDDQGMVSMFQALMASDLAGFLGCPAVIYETALIDFFENASVRDGVIISTVGGQLVEISEEWFTESFELPVDGLGDLSDIPKDVIFDARSIVSLSGEPVILSGRKNQMKFEFRLLCDIMAKAISVKAGSFNAITVEKFSLITTVVCGIRMNWARFLFSIFKKMVTPGSKQAKGFAIQISLMLENIPNLELGASSEFPASKILTDKTVHRFVSINDRDGAEEATGATKQRAASTKRPAADVGTAVTKKNRKLKKKFCYLLFSLEIVVVAQEAIPIQSVPVSPAIEPMVEDQQAEFSKEQPADELPTDKSAASTEERHWFDLSYEELIAKWDADRPVTSPADTDEEIEVERPVFESVAAFGSAVEIDKAPVDDPDTVINQVLQQLDSISADQCDTSIVEGAESLGVVTEFAWHLAGLPKFPADHRGKEPLIEKNPIKGNPVMEQVTLILADIDCLVQVRAKLVDEVAKFFYSFSFKRLANLQIDDSYFDKEELVLTWAEAESTELKKEIQAHGLMWKKTCCSKIFEGRPRDRGAVIARTNSNTPSKCWIRTMLRVNGTIMKKRWADVCLEVAEFCAYRRLLPAGSINFYRALEFVEPDSRVDYRQPTVFALCLSQFCTVQIQYILFSRLTTTDISDFLSSIALERTALRGVQRSFAQSVVPSVQFSLDQRPYSPTSADNSSSLHFDASDLDAAVSSLPSVSPDISAALADFQAILSEQVNESQSGISSRLHKIEQGLRDSLCDQAALFKNLFQEARQEGRTIADVQTLRFNEFRKHTLAQNPSIFTGLADVRKEVQEVNAKVDILASRLNDVQKDVEATKEAISHQIFEFQSQAQENKNILHAQLSELVDYIHRGGADKKGESGSRGPQQPSNVQIEDSAVRPPTFAQRVDMAQRHIVETVLDADSNRESLERQAAAEHDREGRRREANGMQSVVDLFSEIFSRYIPYEQSAGAAGNLAGQSGAAASRSPFG